MHIPVNSAIQSIGNRPPIPEESGHPIIAQAKREFLLLLRDVTRVLFAPSLKPMARPWVWIGKRLGARTGRSRRPRWWIRLLRRLRQRIETVIRQLEQRFGLAKTQAHDT